MAIQTINFGNFEPDLPDIFTQGTSMAKNVIPHQNCYLPFKSISTDTDALTAFCRGAVAYSDGGVIQKFLLEMRLNFIVLLVLLFHL